MVSDFFTCTPVRYEPEAREWSPPPSPSASAWRSASPVMTIVAIAERLERREHAREFEVGAHAFRQPVLVHDAVRVIDDRQAAHGFRRRLLRGRQRGNHRVEQRQRHRGADAAKHGAARNRFFGHDHDRVLILQLRRGPTPAACAFAAAARLGFGWIIDLLSARAISCCAFETACSSRSRESSTTSGSRRPTPRARSRGWPARRDNRSRGRARTSAAFR